LFTENRDGKDDLIEPLGELDWYVEVSTSARETKEPIQALDGLLRVRPPLHNSQS